MKLFVVWILTLVSIQLFATQLDRKLTMPGTVREQLNVEMHKIQAQMNTILDSMSRGQWNKVYTTATDLQNNYIMKQKMDEKELVKLRATLPKEYLSLDKAFHYWAEIIAQGAQKKNAHQVSKAYTELLNTCMLCHAKFAPEMVKDFKDYTPPKTETPKKFYKNPEDWR